MHQFLRESVLFYGPLGIKKKFIGGGEAGNKKTISILTNANLDIYIVEKPYLPDYPIVRNFAIPFRYLNTYISIVLLAIRKKTKIFHLSAFYCNLIFFEYLFISLARKLNMKTIYEIRAGGFITSYSQGTKLYKYFVKQIVTKVDTIMCQGNDYCEFLHNEFNIDSTYYPNYILDKYVQDRSLNNDSRISDSTIQLVYLGRITQSKQINLILEVGKKLKEKSINFKISLIGTGDNSYINQLTEYISSNNLVDNVHFFGGMDFDSLVKTLPSQHFFIFPSNEEREGHSNSLTETMAFGIVPIASNNGFNRTVINNNNLIIENYSSQEYYDKIVEIFNDKQKWQSLSLDVYNRVKDNYTERIVSERLVNVYKKLLS